MSNVGKKAVSQTKEMYVSQSAFLVCLPLYVIFFGHNSIN